MSGLLEETLRYLRKVRWTYLYRDAEITVLYALVIGFPGRGGGGADVGTLIIVHFKVLVLPHPWGIFFLKSPQYLAKPSTQLDLKMHFRTLFWFFQSSQVNLLGKSEICNGSAVLWRHRRHSAQKILKVAKTCFPSFWAEMSCLKSKYLDPRIFFSLALHKNKASTNLTMTKNYITKQSLLWRNFTKGARNLKCVRNNSFCVRA